MWCGLGARPDFQRRGNNTAFGRSHTTVLAVGVVNGPDQPDQLIDQPQPDQTDHLIRSAGADQLLWLVMPGASRSS